MQASYGLSMADDKKSSGPAAYSGWGLGIAVGIAIGVSIGVALDNIAAGIGVGLAIGLAFGLAFTRSKNAQDARGDGDRDKSS
jgi:hypothetical protein